MNKYIGYLAAVHAILWLCLLAWLDYLNEKRRRITQRQLDGLAFLKVIKDNAMRLRQHHYLGKKIIMLKDWRE